LGEAGDGDATAGSRGALGFREALRIVVFQADVRHGQQRWRWRWMAGLRALVGGLTCT